MSKAIIAVICITFLACSKNKSPQQMAKEVCDCFAKNKHVSIPDPETDKAEDECSAMWVKIRESYKNNSSKRIQFNAALENCISELFEKVQKSLGPEK